MITAQARNNLHPIAPMQFLSLSSTLLRRNNKLADHAWLSLYYGGGIGF